MNTSLLKKNVTRVTAAERREKEAAQRRKSEAEQLAKKIELRTRAPLLMLKAMARAEKHSNITIHDGETGFETTDKPLFRVEIRFHQEDDSAILYLTSDEWDFQQIHNTVDTLEAEIAERERKRLVAREAYDKLSLDERDALGLRSRP